MFSTVFRPINRPIINWFGLGVLEGIIVLSSCLWLPAFWFSECLKGFRVFRDSCSLYCCDFFALCTLCLSLVKCGYLVRCVQRVLSPKLDFSFRGCTVHRSLISFIPHPNNCLLSLTLPPIATQR
ncbi:hypothetical protein BS47DRAFT_889802 [Hydnum rufescens UP504]|uniref:Uncharacterized protein n=1 Tax=Hydnum rufescens UP504 TaxID=1448309 RepID=A0A9P6DXT9_9AGAM|nr:hypothetical protein BS47DRAFT_889802 [Hydnum rufescens UP504]